MTDFTFVHASDLHLDSPFQGLSSQAPSIADVVQRATFEAYESLVKLCRREKVDFLTIAGDVYDGADRSLRAQLKFRDGLSELSEVGIHSFVVHGNHDPLDGWSSSIQWPPGVHVFGGEDVETVTCMRDGHPLADISGISYARRSERRNLARQYQPAGHEIFQIGLLHCNCGGDASHEPYAACELNDLVRTGFDYWALGHVHKASILNRDPFVIYSGNSQGRSIREQGPCGCWLVKVKDGQVQEPEFRALDVIRWGCAEIEITGLDSLEALDHAIARRLDDLREKNECRPVICRLRLTGRGPLYRDLSRAGAKEDLLERERESGMGSDPFVWIQALEIDCRPEIDLDQRRQGKDLLAQVLNLSRDLAERQDLQEQISPALADLFENGRAGNALQKLDESALRQLLQEAELLCADLLEGDE